MNTDVIVVGAGPAGSIAALELARAGVDVALLEKSVFPRPKTCGDALIPDSLAVFERLGLLGAVAELGQRAGGIRVYAPSGRYVDVDGRCVCVPREKLDALLVESASASGARVITRADVLGYDSGDQWATVTARVDGVSTTFRSRMVVLATGASAKMMDRFGLTHRSVPSALAMRTYFRLRPDVDEDLLHIWYERPVLPGYAWIFPVGDHVFNVGAGVFRYRRDRPNLRDLFHRFRRECPAARAMLAGAEPLGPDTGAPLRTDLVGCARSADRLLVAGEAIGTTFAFSGEGIGKAMETGGIAAREAIRALSRGAFRREDLAGYDAALNDRLAPRYRRYATAQRWLRHPWVVNLVAWRSAHSPSLRRRLSDVLTEREDPTGVLSLRGLARVVAGR